MTTQERLLEVLPDLLGMLFVFVVYGWAVLHLAQGVRARRVLDRAPAVAEANVTRLVRHPEPPPHKKWFRRPTTSRYGVEYDFTDAEGRTVRGGGNISRATYETLKTKGTLTVHYWLAHSSFSRPENSIEKRWPPYLMLVLGLLSLALPMYGTYVVLRNVLVFPT